MLAETILGSSTGTENRCSPLTPSFSFSVLLTVSAVDRLGGRTQNNMKKAKTNLKVLIKFVFAFFLLFCVHPLRRSTADTVGSMEKLKLGRKIKMASRSARQADSRLTSQRLDLNSSAGKSNQMVYRSQREGS